MQHCYQNLFFMIYFSFLVGLNVSKSNSKSPIIVMSEGQGDIALIGLAVMGQVTLQLGSEDQTSLVFEWSKVV